MRRVWFLCLLTLLHSSEAWAAPSFANVAGTASISDDQVGTSGASGSSWNIGSHATSSLSSSGTQLSTSVNAPLDFSFANNTVEFDLFENALVRLDVEHHESRGPEINSNIWSLCGDASGCVQGNGTSIFLPRTTLFDNGLPNATEDYQRHAGGEYSPSVDHTWDGGAFSGTVAGTWEFEGFGLYYRSDSDYLLALTGQLPADHYTLMLGAEGFQAGAFGETLGSLSVGLEILSVPEAGTGVLIATALGILLTLRRER